MQPGNFQSDTLEFARHDSATRVAPVARVQRGAGVHHMMWTRERVDFFLRFSARPPSVSFLKEKKPNRFRGRLN